ncbi:MAG: hypothetical protein IT365_23040 [Candidatus Hydrogenedentes bacterium]|nr:hypothetical protein [Candidatus Hydrogenedentota bacterium]
MATVACASGESGPSLSLPDAEIAVAYEKAATQNVLAAVNPNVFVGYWSVCADGIGFGYGNTYPALDGHQMADALLWLGKIDVVRANWDYVKSFQRPNGQLPFAILPSLAGQEIGPEGARAPVDANGGLYRHWVPADPLRALGYPTYIQNADIIFRYTGDGEWLGAQLPSINLAADFLASLTTPEGAVAGAGYYVERPTRVEYDGVAQCYSVDAFRRVADLNAIAGNTDASARYRRFADSIESHFRTRFWVKDHFAEYIHPERGVIATHGFTDVDWAAIATGGASAEQCAILWPQLRNEPLFRYSGMPTGIATHPEAYESWEFAYDDRMDLAAMGRVWYLECWARARMGDAPGLVDAIRRVCEVGKSSGYYWRERYGAEGGFGAEKYCEYPANLIRIVQRFLLGVEYTLDGALVLAPTVSEEYWQKGFGQTLQWRGRRFAYTLTQDTMQGEYAGKDSLEVRVRFPVAPETARLLVTADGQKIHSITHAGYAVFTIPEASPEKPCRLTVLLSNS